MIYIDVAIWTIKPKFDLPIPFICDNTDYAVVWMIYMLDRKYWKLKKVRIDKSVILKWPVAGAVLLTLKWPGTFTPVPWNPPEKTIFPPEFCNEICTIYVRDIKNHNSAKKKKNLNVVLF